MCLHCIYAQYLLVGQQASWGLCRQVGSDGLIPTLTDLRSVLVLSRPVDTSGAGLQSGSATSGQSLKLCPERGGLTFLLGGGVPLQKGAGLVHLMSLRGGALVLLVYGGFILQQNQAQVATPAPCKNTQTQ